MKTLGLVFPLLAAVVSAQSYEELPKGYTNTVDTIYDSFLLSTTSRLPVHLQNAYDVNDISVGGGQFTELAYHRNNYWGNTVPAGSVTCTVTMSHAAAAPDGMSSTFANNLNTLTKQVFSGTVNFPAAAKGTGPAPWTHVIKLTSPFTFAKGAGKSLVVDFVITATTGYTGTHPLDASGPDVGTRSTNGTITSQCKFSNGNYNNSLSYTTGGLTNNGGGWYVQYSNLLPSAPGVATLSGFGIDNKGIWPLPIDLGPIGAPNCLWQIGLESPFWVPLTADANGRAKWPTVTIPAGLGGLSFYDNAVFLDQQANAAGLVTTWSGKWYIGTGVGPLANTLYRTTDTTPPQATGFFRTGYGTHLRITR